MSIFAITPPLTPTYTKKVVDSTSIQDAAGLAESGTIAPTPSVITPDPQTLANANTAPIDTTGSLTQNVLETLQTMGVNTGALSAESTLALQDFVQSLYGALTPSGTNVADTLISGGSQFKYTMDMSQANLGDYLPSVVESLKSAFENLGRYIHSDIVFNVKVIGQHASPDILAEADAAMTQASVASQKMLDTSFVSDVTFKSELHPNSPDANLFINLSRMGDMSFKGAPAPDKFDFTSIVTHEILHGLAFTGVLGNAATSLRTKYDDLVMMQNKTPYFIGMNAQQANSGKPVPLVSERAGTGSAFYHVAIPGDLMADTIQKGQIENISPLDVAMLKDMGIPVVDSPDSNVPANLTKAQNAYSSAPNRLQNLIDSLQETNKLNSNFEHLVLTLTPSASATNSAPVTLPSFLAQLALNTQHTDALQNTVGSLISVAA